MAAAQARPQLRTYSKRVLQDSYKPPGKRKLLEDTDSCSNEEISIVQPVLKKRIISDYFKPAARSSSPTPISSSITESSSPSNASSRPGSSSTSSLISSSTELSTPISVQSGATSSIPSSPPSVDRERSSSPLSRKTSSNRVSKRRAPRRLTTRPSILRVRDMEHSDEFFISLAARKRWTGRLTLRDAIQEGGLRKNVDPAIASINDETFPGLPPVPGIPLTARPRSPVDLGDLIRKEKDRQAKEKEARESSEMTSEETSEQTSTQEQPTFRQEAIRGNTPSKSLIAEKMKDPKNKAQGNLVQSQLSLGQDAIVHCHECQLSYNRSLHEEREWHREHHDAYSKGVPIKHLTAKRDQKPWSKIDEDGLESCIIVVDRYCRHHWQDLALDVLYDHVDPDLGASRIPDHVIWSRIPDPRLATDLLEASERHLNQVPDQSINANVSRVDRYKVYLYVKDKRVVSFLLAEQIATGYGYQVENQAEKIPVDESSKRLNIPMTATKVPIDKPYDCFMGVSKIWTHEKHRMNGYARLLIDVARDFNFIPNQNISRKQIAFTNPTAQGENLAKSIQSNDKYSWLEYTPIEDYILFDPRPIPRADRK